MEDLHEANDSAFQSSDSGDKPAAPGTTNPRRRRLTRTTTWVKATPTTFLARRTTRPLPPLLTLEQTNMPRFGDVSRSGNATVKEREVAGCASVGVRDLGAARRCQALCNYGDLALFLAPRAARQEINEVVTTLTSRRACTTRLSPLASRSMFVTLRGNNASNSAGNCRTCVWPWRRPPNYERVDATHDADNGLLERYPDMLLGMQRAVVAEAALFAAGGSTTTLRSSWITSQTAVEVGPRAPDQLLGPFGQPRGGTTPAPSFFQCVDL